MLALSEKDWQVQVRGMFLQFGWERELFYHTWSSLKSQRGFPDIIAGKDQVPSVWQPASLERALAVYPAVRLLVVELKRDDKYLRPSQTLWMDLFNASARSFLTKAIEVYVWRPRDTEEVATILYGHEPPPPGGWPTSWDVCRGREMANLAPEKSR